MKLSRQYRVEYLEVNRRTGEQRRKVKQEGWYLKPTNLFNHMQNNPYKDSLLNQNSILIEPRV